MLLSRRAALQGTRASSPLLPCFSGGARGLPSQQRGGGRGGRGVKGCRSWCSVACGVCGVGKGARKEPAPSSTNTSSEAVRTHGTAGNMKPRSCLVVAFALALALCARTCRARDSVVFVGSSEQRASAASPQSSRGSSRETNFAQPQRIPGARREAVTPTGMMPGEEGRARSPAVGAPSVGTHLRAVAAPAQACRHGSSPTRPTPRFIGSGATAATP